MAKTALNKGIITTMTKNYWEWNDNTQTKNILMAVDMIYRMDELDSETKTRVGDKLENMMIEFAKMHVEAALMAAHRAAVREMDGCAWDRVYNKKFLLEAYSVDKIK